MKTHLDIRVLGLIVGLNLFALPAGADLEVSASVRIHTKAEFEAPLATHGVWVQVGSYGRCWRPAHVAVGWRPYCLGEWVWTDCGWYWASDEPWAWACYHYGWWVYDTDRGWVWVPGVEWAPAWVSWRVGGGYIGWAPLCPPGRFFARHPSPEHFVFVGVKNFGGPVRASTLIVKNTIVINKTSLVGGVKRESRNFEGASRKVMVNNGPGIDMVRKASGKTFAAAPITQVSRRTPGPAPSRRGGAEFASHGSRPSPDKPDHAPARTDARGNESFRPAPEPSAEHGSGRGSPFGGGRQGGHSGGRGRH